MFGSPPLRHQIVLLVLIAVGFALPPFVPEYYLFLLNSLMVWAALTHPLFVDSLYFLPGMAVLTLTILGNFLMVRAISLSPLSLVIPVMSLTPVFTSLIGTPFFFWLVLRLPRSAP